MYNSLLKSQCSIVLGLLLTLSLGCGCLNQQKTHVWNSKLPILLSKMTTKRREGVKNCWFWDNIVYGCNGLYTLQHMYWSKYSLCYVPILIYLLCTTRTTKVHFNVLFYYIGHLICLYLRPFGCCFQESWDVYNDCSQSYRNDVVQNTMRSWIKLMIDMRGANSHVSLWKSRKNINV